HDCPRRLYRIEERLHRLLTVLIGILVCKLPYLARHPYMMVRSSTNAQTLKTAKESPLTTAMIFAKNVPVPQPFGFLRCVGSWEHCRKMAFFLHRIGSRPITRLNWPLFLAMLFSAAGAARADLTNLTPVADTYLIDALPDVNSGS